ncbi:8-oxoguanine DNA glycosylase [Muricoccus vinaceus]|uniref:8-oxoguanine DNA glycosylase n=1 Tax=Muricoccus vinaceus TaxID=424704 RepID=A0ABV6IVJ2_9PROT
MPQTIHHYADGQFLSRELPGPDAEALPDVPWGRVDALMTPAYWLGQCWQAELLGLYGDFRLGSNLREEVAACLLGGWGMPAELGLTAFARLRDRGMLTSASSATALEHALSEPFRIEGRDRRYRFPRQRSRHLACCLVALDDLGEPEDDRDLRDALRMLPGLGWKTSSWVVRNHRASGAVAIIDVHLVRAGRVAGFFEPCWDQARDYATMEEAFLRFADAIGVRASLLDALMWDQMRRFGDLAIQAERRIVSPIPRPRRTRQLELI